MPIHLASRRSVHVAGWVFFAGCLVAVSASSSTFGQAPSSGRKSTDPPAPVHGKFGQDLFLAIDHHDLGQVKQLIARGADPNSTNGLEMTPIDIAAAEHETDVMNALLAAGANPECRSTYGTPLTFAAATGNNAGADLLLTKGVKVDLQRTDGLTPLMAAANIGDVPLVTDLLAHGASVSRTDEDGSTALTIAARGGFTPVAALLVHAGAAIDVPNHEQQTPLMLAAKNGHADCVRLLLHAGANPNATDAEGRTALALDAAYGDNAATAKALLAAGSNAKLTDRYGRTAADYAALRDDRGPCSVLGAHPASTAPRTAQRAVSLSVKLVESAIGEFDRLTSCASCHQEGLGRIATAAARLHGYPLDAKVEAAQTGRLDGMLRAMRPLHEGALRSPEVMKQIPLIEINEVSTTDTWILAGMAAHGSKPDAAKAAMTLVLAKQQLSGGNWSFSVPREPLQSSDFTYTALSVRAMQTYGPPSAKGELAQRIAKAKRWLSSSKPKTSDDRAFRLLGLHWTHAGAAAERAAARAIRTAQQPDGGWAQLPGMRSDAYATGQALYALKESGQISATDPAYRRGTAFLLRTQDDDGSWYVNKRAIPANNYFDAGFPHGESQYASFDGTCYAILALLETLPSQRP